MRGAGHKKVINAVLSSPRLKGRALIFALPYIIEKQIKQETYDFYVAENLRLIGENTAKQVTDGKYIAVKWAELVNPKPKDTRTGDEIAKDVINRLGLTVE